MICQLNDLSHIFNGIYLYDRPHLALAQAQDIHTFLMVGEGQAPVQGRVHHLPIDGVITDAQVREGAAFLNRQVSAGERILVVSAADFACAVVVVMAYLIEYEGMDLANAYTLAAQSTYLVQIPPTCLIHLMRAYELPYKEADVRDPYFTAYLVAWVRENLSRIIRGVHISGITALEHQTRTRQKGIEAVLRLDDSRRIGFNWSDDFLLCDLPLMDGLEISANSLERGSGFIHEQVVEGRNILVHCEMGVSRSVTMVLAYLIRWENMSLPQAFATIVKKRAIAHPHPRLFASLVSHFGLPYSPEAALDLDFYQCLLLEAVGKA